MAKVIKFVKNKWFDEDMHNSDLVNDDQHYVVSTGDDRTVCGIQTDGEDGISPSEYFDGYVTCEICFYAIDQIKAIKRWKQSEARNKKGEKSLQEVALFLNFSVDRVSKIARDLCVGHFIKKQKYFKSHEILQIQNKLVPPSGYLSIKQLSTEFNVSRHSIRMSLRKINIISTTKRHGEFYYSQEQVEELEDFYTSVSPEYTISCLDLVNMVGLKSPETIKYWLNKLNITPDRNRFNKIMLTYRQASMILPNIGRADKDLVNKAMKLFGSRELPKNTRERCKVLDITIVEYYRLKDNGELVPLLKTKGYLR